MSGLVGLAQILLGELPAHVVVGVRFLEDGLPLSPHWAVEPLPRVVQVAWGLVDVRNHTKLSGPIAAAGLDRRMVVERVFAKFDHAGS